MALALRREEIGHHCTFSSYEYEHLQEGGEYRVAWNAINEPRPTDAGHLLLCERSPVVHFHMSDSIRRYECKFTLRSLLRKISDSNQVSVQSFVETNRQTERFRWNQDQYKGIRV